MMTKHGTTVPLLLFCLASAVLMAGCLLSPQPDRSKFFVLAPDVAQGAAVTPSAAGAAHQLVVGLGPIKLPEYLDRSEVVTRVAPNRLELSPDDKWAEPLSTDFRQVMAQDLSARLATQMITFYPWYRTTRIDYQVRIDVYRFERDSHDTATLVAHWQIFDGTGAILYATDSAITEPGQPGEPGAATMSRALGALADQITSAIRSMRTAAPRNRA
jgi:uncharacterized lipoprotein YmbA